MEAALHPTPENGRFGGNPGSAPTLLDSIADFCRQRGVAESTFGRRAVNDGRSLTIPKVLVNNNVQASLDSTLQTPYASTNASTTVATTSSDFAVRNR